MALTDEQMQTVRKKVAQGRPEPSGRQTRLQADNTWADAVAYEMSLDGLNPLPPVDELRDVLVAEAERAA